MMQASAMLDRMMGFLGLRAPLVRWEAAPVEARQADPRGRRDDAARVSTVGSYYAFRRELDRHEPGMGQGGSATWHQDFRPGGRADAIAESHFGHPLASPVVRFVHHGRDGTLARIELTWRGHRSARVIWTGEAGLTAG